MKEVKISVIIPIYKVEKYIDKTISSVVAQPMDDLEIILVDDGSPDKCPMIIDDWASRDGRVKAIHKLNDGVTMARKTGLDNATGEYIYFLDGDDYLIPECLSKLYDAAVNSNADWVISDFLVEYPDGRRMEKRFESFLETDSIGFLKYSYRQPDFYVTGRLVRRSFIVNATIDIPKEITYGEDNIMVTQLGTQLTCASKADCFSLVYVQREGSVTNRCSQKDLEQRARACKICYHWLSGKSFFNEIQDIVDNYFIKEYVGSLRIGYMPEAFLFVVSNCRYDIRQHSVSDWFLYLSAKLNIAMTLKAVNGLRKMLRK